MNAGITPFLRTAFNNYIRYSRLRRRRIKRYYGRLLKAALLIVIVPFILIFSMMIYGRLSLLEGLFGAVAVLMGCMVITRPYLTDLSALTSYVEQLALDRKAEAPPLGFISNVEELSSAVKNLHHIWGVRKMELEAALAESRILFDTLPDMLVMLNDQLEIVRANNAAFLGLGQKIISVPFENIVKDGALLEIVKEVLLCEEGKEFDVALEHQKLGKRDYWVHIERFPVHTAGGLAIVIVMSDVTQSKKARQLVKDFVANASHEIRTPLTSLIGFIETVQDMGEEDAEERERFLSIMAEQAEHMRKLVSELLSLSKIEMNEHTPPTAEVDIKEIINTAIKRVKWMADEKDIALKIEYGKKIPLIVGDADELVQVAVNLISNAIKYSATRTQIEIASDIISQFPVQAERLKVTGKQGIYIKVKDEGEGISEEHLPRITERFYRVDKVRSRKEGGSGLGLSIVKHIINRHAGDLCIESVVGKGSTFTVYLPLAL